MPEEVLFETESHMSREDIAAVLRNAADKLDAGDAITLSAGSDSITVTPPATPEFEVKVERETSTGADTGELSVEFELEWDENQSGSDGTDGTLSVE
ncbi:amphi-Trp domain-containing protein [Halorubellus sp. JP-L1]|uniref:amphi-Trp domain-containing protein n=1 Tax=Halorubellus sp. JP-L1 TaxID=2715753 RepID=UPI001409D76A|nr:amphi-Trp domain-containing protein [Halorubellus sp. JP-L1]NHN40685.1 amphi-Trp domain-containing protein [Halorubellus sp. JP-L1]